jgi:hypothetical protein
MQHHRWQIPSNNGGQFVCTMDLFSPATFDLMAAARTQQTPPSATHSSQRWASSGRCVPQRSCPMTVPFIPMRSLSQQDTDVGASTEDKQVFLLIRTHTLSLTKSPLYFPPLSHKKKIYHLPNPFALNHRNPSYGCSSLVS